MQKNSRSTLEVAVDLLTEFGTLVRTEADLARAETSEKISQVGSSLGFMVFGAALLIPALVILLQAVVSALQVKGGLQPWAAAVIVGGVALAVGLLLFAVGIGRLRLKHLVPHKTVRQLQRDTAIVKSQLRNGYDDVQRAA
jgi:Putative Actinobacterial Holin-X, holin superfamily III